MIRSHSWLSVAIAAMVLLGCSVGAGDAPTVEGPESKDLAGRLSGCVIRTKAPGEIVALSLPTLRESIVRPAAPADADFYPTIHALSGPDKDGRIAYIEDHFCVANEKDQKHLLKTIKLDGKADTEIFSRRGSAMWAATPAGGGEIGSQLALAPSGGKVAFLSELSDRQMPDALLYEGKIEIWDVARKIRLDLSPKAIDQPMSWMPDGRRLLYVRLIPRDELPNPATGLEHFGDYVKDWSAVPAVYVLDTKSGKSDFLQVGWLPVACSDGKTILVGGWKDRSELIWDQLHLEKGESKRVEWPGAANGAFAAPAEDLVLYWGLPTADAPIKYTKHHSPFIGPKLMLTVKVARIDSPEFQTVVPEIDPRSLVSFGSGSNKK
jgi:hypothetical protein